MQSQSRCVNNVIGSRGFESLACGIQAWGASRSGGQSIPVSSDAWYTGESPLIHLKEGI